MLFFFICTRTKHVYSINGPKFGLEVKQLLFPLFRPNTILVKNLETLACVFPFPMLIWVLQQFQCFKIHVAQHWRGRGHITVRTKVWAVNLRNFLKIQEKWCLFQRFLTRIVADDKAAYIKMVTNRKVWLDLRKGKGEAAKFWCNARCEKV